MRRLPVYLVLDVSGSMRGDPIAGVNAGVGVLMSTLRKDPNALETAFVSVITFDDTARQVVPLTELVDFRMPPLTVDKGLTALGAALKLTAERISAEVAKSTPDRKGDWLPLVFIMTDGEPTDDWGASLAEFKAAAKGTVVACGAGANADTWVLKQITGNVVETATLDQTALGSFFKWVSASVTTVSEQIDRGAPTYGGDLKNLPPLPPELKITETPRKGSEGEGGGPFNADRARRAANLDKYGNPEGSEFDLAKDGAFKGMEVGVLHLYTGEGFDFRLPSKALEEKGFSVRRWANQPPSAKDLAKALPGLSQLWIVSDAVAKLKREHLDQIAEFFESGRGVYIWGDNAPYFADANAVASRLLGAGLAGDAPGEQVLTEQARSGGPGFLRSHPISTGLERLYEGVTISSVTGRGYDPVMIGSHGQPVVAAWSDGGRRALVDGGFTRLFCNWDTAGTARYVKNAAAWLVNHERFGGREPETRKVLF